MSKGLKLKISKREVNSDKFLTEEEKNNFWPWVERIVAEFPEYNTHEKLLEYLQIYKEMCFQNS